MDGTLKQKVGHPFDYVNTMWYKCSLPIFSLLLLHQWPYSTKTLLLGHLTWYEKKWFILM